MDMKEVCHVGFICFPNIENKAVLKEAGLGETELKVERFTFICPIDHPSIFGPKSKGNVTGLGHLL